MKPTAVLGSIGLAFAIIAASNGLGGAARAAESASVSPALNHSAPYTRLIGPASTKAPVRFAQRSVESEPASSPSDNSRSAATPKKIPAQAIGWHHRYYAGYGGWYGAAPWGMYGSAFPYYSGYYNLGYRPMVSNTYVPWTYSYTPWVGGWSGYPNYTLLNPGFGGYYGVGYGGYGGWGAYGANYGGCCYW